MCECIGKANDALQPKGLRLVTGWRIDPITRECTVFLIIPTEKRPDARRGSKPQSIVPTFCPFCGEKYKPQGESDASL
jgi:hypothetical protein